MSISATSLDGQQAGTLDADLDQLAQDMNRLHHMARSAADVAARERFASLQHSVNWRLNQLAYVLAAHDGDNMILRH